ncbi:hypothetical protein GQF03_07905 [Sneathiella chungangensis]|uniref:Uncharacterized protein n=1 Tax=Sneathiella chungangensis TaxID=1418234 RepID=A0A845MFN5_9PROT|nr:hypothetical protein [Sneathiella chungangensis]MZR22250.1 hypothetical protein [Sneathiella chungangensis]
MEFLKEYKLYLHTIFKYTWANTWRLFSGHILASILVAVIFASSGFIYGALVTPIDQYKELENTFISGVVVALIALAFMLALALLWYFATSSFGIWRQQVSEINDLKNAIKNNLDKTPILEAFHSLADTGNALRIKRIKEDEFESWRREVVEFRNTAISMIRNYVSRTEAIEFNITDVRIDTKFDHAIDDKHNLEILRLRIQIDKLLKNIKVFEKN